MTTNNNSATRWYNFFSALSPARLAMLLVLCSALSATAGTRPGSKDAACDAISLKYRSSNNIVSPREMNFFLFDAAAQGCIELASQFIEAGASIAARDRFGNTALLIAARMGQSAILDLLLQKGASVHQTNLAGSSALLRATTMNRRKTIVRLLEEGVDANLANSQQITPLIAATYNGNQRIVRLLLDHGADPSVADATEKSPLVYAAGRGYLSIVKLLLETGNIDVNAKHGNDLTALMWATGHSNDVPEAVGVNTVDYLLTHGARVDTLDNRGRSALSIAAERGHPLIVELLLVHGAQPARRDKDGKSAIDLAANQHIADTLRTALAKQDSGLRD